MSYKLKIGKGKGSSFKCPIGSLELNIHKGYTYKTIKYIADKIAKYYNIKNGEVELLNITFIIYKEAVE